MKPYPLCYDLILDLVSFKSCQSNLVFDRNDWVCSNFVDFEVQTNCYDCGVYCCLFIKRICLNEPFSFKKLDFHCYRKIILFEILQNKLLSLDEEYNFIDSFL